MRRKRQKKVRKGKLPPPSRPHKDRRESMIERMWRELRRLGFDE